MPVPRSRFRPRPAGVSSGGRDPVSGPRLAGFSSGVGGQRALARRALALASAGFSLDARSQFPVPVSAPRRAGFSSGVGIGGL